MTLINDLKLKNFVVLGMKDHLREMIEDE